MVFLFLSFAGLAIGVVYLAWRHGLSWQWIGQLGTPFAFFLAAIFVALYSIGSLAMAQIVARNADMGSALRDAFQTTWSRPLRVSSIALFAITTTLLLRVHDLFIVYGKQMGNGAQLSPVADMLMQWILLFFVFAITTLQTALWLNHTYSEKSWGFVPTKKRPAFKRPRALRELAAKSMHPAPVKSRAIVHAHALPYDFKVNPQNILKLSELLGIDPMQDRGDDEEPSDENEESSDEQQATSDENEESSDEQQATSDAGES